MTIFDVIRLTGAVIWADERRGLLVSYNGSSQFNIWEQTGRNWSNVDIWTASTDICKSTVDDLERYVDSRMEAWVAPE